MKKILILGCGRVGLAMANDLVGEFDVSVMDTNYDNLYKFTRGKRIRKDFTDYRHLRPLVEDSDLVIGAAPGFLGHHVVKRVIEIGAADMVDISFFPEDALELHRFAKGNGVRVAVDCGIAPGAWNMLLASATRSMDKVHKCLCYVGGLPVEREWPYEYKAGFSPIDVIEEYTRPARYLKDGEVVTMPALSEPEFLDFPEVGKLEAFNTDGLRTLLTTLDIPTVIEKTLRYPGHIELMRVLRETGLFSQEGVEMLDTSNQCVRVRPIDLTTKLLFPMWEFKEGEKDQTIMRIVIDGEQDGHGVRDTYDLHDIAQNGVSSMARTTGYTCTAVARAMLNGLVSDKPGIYAPEEIGGPATDFVMQELKKRGVNFEWDSTPLNE